ncbi:unnamed protein product [Arctogadus glacialis]
MGPGLCLRRAAGFLNVFLERRQADEESGGLMEKPYIWKANPEDKQDSTIKDSSSSAPRPPDDLLSSAV